VDKKQNVYFLGPERAQGNVLVGSLPADRAYISSAFDTAEAFMDAVSASPPDCAVLDITPVGSGSLAVLEALRSRSPQIPIILVSHSPALAMALDAVRRGQVEFHALATPADLEGLAEAVARACSGPQITTADVLGEMCRQSVLEKLSPRETEVLRLLVAGYQNKSIAHTLGISPRTVEVHRARMMRRLGVSSFAELIRLAVEAGLRGA
jgi:two-component system response regulator FixJ